MKSNKSQDTITQAKLKTRECVEGTSQLSELVSGSAGLCGVARGWDSSVSLTLTHRTVDFGGRSAITEVKRLYRFIWKEDATGQT